jgi:YhcH/YjgK/YiaL family protein
MIYGSLRHIEEYTFLPENILRALRIMRDTDFSALADGAHEVDGYDFRFILQSYIADSFNETPEAHRDFIDIQLLLKGKEQIGVAPLECMTETVSENPDADIWFYRGPTDAITLCDDRFVILYPSDAHSPCSAPPEGATEIRKCVFKIHV